MPLFYQHAVKISWLLLGLYWLWSSRRIKTVDRMEAPFKRFMAYHLPLFAACVLLGEGEWYGDTWLHRRFLAELAVFQPAGLVLVIGGVFLAVWARHMLGRNWSVAPQLKHEHELIQSGPYRHVRHPIYSGLLLAFLGTTVMIGEWRALLAFAIVLASFAHKYRVEERMLQRHFGEGYRQYAARTGALLPWAD
jgi:protein-S-isoprenylcysteine O-methyltransferase Ste14